MPRTALLVIIVLLGVSACRQHSGNATTAAQPHINAQNSHRGTEDNAGNDESIFDVKRHPDAVTGVALDPVTLTPSQRKYGIAPKRDPRVTYAPEVILMERGDQAIQAAGDDGMTWTFDAGSPHVSEFEEGKIIFATGRAVGRIGQLTHSGNTVVVKLTPVQINEVIQSGHFIIDTDIDTSKMLIYEAPEFPSVLDFHAPSAKSTRWESWRGGGLFNTAVQLPSGLGSTQLPVLPPMTPPPGSQIMSLSNGALKTFPLLGSDGYVGVGFGYHKDGVNLEAWGQLGLKSAHIKFELLIQDFKIVTAGMDLGGASSLKIKLEAGSDSNSKFINASQLVESPVDIYVPFSIAGAPLGLTIHTSFIFKTAFSANKSVMTADGEYTFEGNVFIGFKNGEPQITPFTKAAAKTSLASNIQGVSVGINALAISFKVEPMIGIGAFGFNTGVYVGLSFGGSVLRQSDVVLSHCRSGYMNGIINAGVGYQLPASFVAVVNGILSVFTKYRITGSGHLLEVPDHPFMKLDESIPPGCSTPGQST